VSIKCDTRRNGQLQYGQPTKSQPPKGQPVLLHTKKSTIAITDQKVDITAHQKVKPA